ncbi:MAG: hypothetical protein ACIAQU_02725 [Phycisphaerales bacterium JB064]
MTIRTNTRRLSKGITAASAITLFALAATLPACEDAADETGDALEDAGEAVDDAVDDAGDAIDDAGDELGG